ncbi:MAG: tetratricopeptide repeat protein [Betaproteobacteria bacterium]|nr:tetratricopeptide repeat protein [Betaproteobacteria bacterium]
MPAASLPSLAPATALALRAQAVVLLGEGRLAEAERTLQVVLRERPGDPEARYLLGVVALQAGNAAAALSLLLPAARANPANALAQYNAAMALVLANRFGEAAQLLRQALTLDPRLGPAWNNLGNILKAFGEIDQATQCYERAIALGPDDPIRQSHHLICVHYSAGFSHEQIFSLHQRWAERHAARHYPPRPPVPTNPDPRRALTIGLVSPSFNGKIVGQFLRGLLPQLHLQGLRLIAYSATRETDDITAAIRASVDRWHDITGLEDAAAAQLVAADGVDILIDLAGHAPGNRLLLFARQPAPIQVSWLDYFDTTGLAIIDYLITDARTTPIDSPQRFSEQLLRLPETRLCWTPPDFAPEVAPAPSTNRGYITFGSFNRADKLNPELLGLWARILERVPDARLLLKGEAFAMTEVRRHFTERFAALGVSSERVEWRGASSHAELLGEYGALDIALDTTPYNGGATTCDALWMGVPVIALRAERMIARQSAAMLDCVGLSELVADTPEQYLEIAVALAGDRARLARMRADLRANMARSALCDTARFARDFAAALRQIWQQRCAEADSKEEYTDGKT